MLISDHFADAALGAKGLTTAPLCALTPAPLTRRRRRMGAKEPPPKFGERRSRASARNSDSVVN